MLSFLVFQGAVASVPWIVQRCGRNSTADDFTSPAQCNPSGVHPCCGPHGVCASGDENCACPTCIDYRTFPWTNEGTCGGTTVGSDGITSPAQCDPNGEYYCCSGSWCGNTAAHCECEGCVDYRPLWNSAGSCGPVHAGARGNVPGQCDPASESPCCSPYGWCGNTAAHCDCADCIDYQNPPQVKAEEPEAVVTVGVDLTSCEEPETGAALVGAIDRVTASVAEMLGRSVLIASVGVLPLGQPRQARMLATCASINSSALSALALIRCLLVERSCPVDSSDATLAMCSEQLQMDTASIKQCLLSTTTSAFNATASTASCGIDVSVTGALSRGFEHTFGAAGASDQLSMSRFATASMVTVPVSCCGNQSAATGAASAQASCDLTTVACAAYPHKKAQDRNCTYIKSMNARCESDRDCNSETCRPLPEHRQKGELGICSLPDPQRHGTCRNPFANPGAINLDGPVINSFMKSTHNNRCGPRDGTT
jgi:hypothetical protein